MQQVPGTCTQTALLLEMTLRWSWTYTEQPEVEKSLDVPGVQLFVARQQCIVYCLHWLACQTAFLGKICYSPFLAFTHVLVMMETSFVAPADLLLSVAGIEAAAPITSSPWCWSCRTAPVVAAAPVWLKIHRVQALWSALCWRRLRLKTKRTWCHFWFLGKIRGNSSVIKWDTRCKVQGGT